MSYYVYILHSKLLDRYYIGQTGIDLQLRISRHLAGGSRYTKRAKDWELVYSEEFVIRADAMNREKYLKSLKDRQMITQLVPARIATQSAAGGESR